MHVVGGDACAVMGRDAPGGGRSRRRRRRAPEPRASRRLRAAHARHRGGLRRRAPSERDWMPQHRAARRPPGRARRRRATASVRRSRGSPGRPCSARRRSRTGSAAPSSSATPTCARTQASRPGQQVPADAQRARPAAARPASASSRARGPRASGAVTQQRLARLDPQRARRRRAARRRRTTPTPSATTAAVVSGSGQSARASSRSTASPSMSKWGSVRSSQRRQPPRPVAEQRHDGGRQRHPHEERVDHDADGEAECDRLERRIALGHERREDREHDEGGGGDDAGGGREARPHGAQRRCARPRPAWRRPCGRGHSPRACVRRGTPRSPSPGRTARPSARSA